MIRHLMVAFSLLFAASVAAQPAPPAPPADSQQPAADEQQPTAPTPTPPTAPAPPAPAAPAPTPPAAPAQGLTPPTLKKPAEAVYPPDALNDKVEARVILEIEISTEGFVDQSSVVESVIVAQDGTTTPATGKYGFAQAAQVAAGNLEFNPAMENGAPIPIRVNYTFNFKLPPEPVAPPPDKTPVPDKTVIPPKKPVVNYTGTILERGTRRTLPGVKVTVYRGEGDTAEGYESVTDDDGSFKFYDLGPGEWNVQLEADGYYDAKTTETMSQNELVEGRYFIEKRSYNPYDVIVEADRPKKEVTRRTLSAAEIATVPGTLGDPVTVVENLPGVARPAFGFGQLIVRGSGPGDTGVYVDGVLIPLIYHFGGLKSVLPTNVVETIDFYPGNFSVEYGRALGGILDARIRRLEPDAVHGSVDISVLDSSLYVEAPIGDDAAVAVAGRRSYIDFVLDAAIPDDASIGLVQAPRYYDLQALANWRPKPAHDLRLFSIASNDAIELLFEDPAADIGAGPQNGSASASTSFQRVALEHRYTPSQRFKNRLKFAVGRDVLDFSAFGIFRLDIRSKVVNARDTATWTLSDNIKVSAGFDSLLQVVDGGVRAPAEPEEGEGGGGSDPTDFRVATLDSLPFFSNGLFVEGQLKAGNFLFVPGLRSDYFTQSDALTFDPRLLVRYDQPTWAVKAGAGIVHQEAPPNQTNETTGNPDLDVRQAYQYSVGAEWKPLEYFSIDGTVFYKDLNNLVGRSSNFTERDGEVVPLVWENNESGRVYGAEVYIRHDFHNNLRGWISYTLSRAERTENDTGDDRLFDFDQTHIFAAVASYRLPRNWEIGARMRIVTGSPITPVIGSVFLDDEDGYRAILGPVNSDRLPTFHQLDLRVDKMWVYDTWRLSAYLSLINSYNNANVEAVGYSFDFSQQVNTNGLPIVPIFGLKGEW